MPLPSDSKLVDLCGEPKNYTLLSDSNRGSRVVHLHECNKVVKFGSFVTRHEARSQQLFRAKVKREKVYVPEVYHFFEHNEKGYLVMEFIDGEKSGKLSSTQSKNLKKAVEHVHSIRYDSVGVIGPLGGGKPAGGDLFYRAYDDYFDRFDSKDKIEAYFRLYAPNKHGPNLQRFDWHLVFFDWVDRNTLWKGNVPCLVDFAAAGVYPTILERAFLRIHNNEDCQFQNVVKSAMPLTTKDEEDAYKIVMEAYGRSTWIKVRALV